MDFHVLNGDFALKLFQKSSLPGEAIVWRETYLEGPLPEGDLLHIFRSARAEFLSRFAEIAHIGFDSLYRNLKKMDEFILELPENSNLILWFDSCIFDQTILMRILYLLSQRKREMPSVFLYCCEGICLTEHDFRDGMNQKKLLSCGELQTARRAWKSFQKKDASGMRQLAETADFDSMPAMKKALFRLADEVPDQYGLTRTQRQILQLVSNGCRDFKEIFTGFDAFEEYPFLGDTACQRHLDFLTANKFLVCENQSYRISQTHPFFSSEGN